MSTTAGAALSCVNDALHHLGLLPPIRKEHFNRFRMRCDLKMGLTNLKSFLLLLENDDDSYAESLGILFSKIQDVAGIVDTGIEVDCDLYFYAIDQVQYLAKQLGIFQPHSLTVDEAVGIADSVLENTVDFLRLANLEIVLSAYVYDNLDALEVQIRFLKSFLLYAVGIGVEQKQLHNLLARVQPYAINAACVFIKDYPDKAFDRGIFVEVESKSSKLSFSYSHLCDQAYLEALCTLRLYHPTQCIDDDDEILRNFLDSLISLLWSKWQFSSYLFEFRYNRLRVSLYGRLRSCRALLKLSSRNLDGEIRNQIGVLVCDAGILLFSFRPTDADILDLLKRFDTILEEVETSTSEFSFPRVNDQLQFVDPTNVNISGGGEEEDIQVLKNIGMASCHHRSSTAKAVGFQDDEISSMRNGLLR